MYVININTTEGPKRAEINDMTEIDKALAPYLKIYTGFKASYVEGEAKEIAPGTQAKLPQPKVRITDYDIDWKKIKSACMTTISKQAGPKEPSDEWKRKLLLAEHSPIRRGSIAWKFDEIPYCISTHFVRHHEGVEKWVGTSRADRTEIKDRSQRTQMDMVPMEMEANIQALINISAKRLCTAADPLTRQYWRGVLEAIREYDENIFWACVPQCVKSGGCPEYSKCGFFDSLTEDWTKEEVTNVTTRYDKYNEWREKAWKLQRIKK